MVMAAKGKDWEMSSLSTEIAATEHTHSHTGNWKVSIEFTCTD